MHRSTLITTTTAVALLLLVVAPATVSAWTCPVPNIPSSYYMFEGYDMTSSQPFYTPFFSTSTDNITWEPSYVYVEPQCVDISAKALQMQSGRWDVASFSDNVGGTGFSTAQVSSACTGDVMFDVVYSQFGFHILDAALECIAEIAAPDNLDTSFTLRTCNGSVVLATAKKSLRDGSLVVPWDRTYPAFAVWTVNTMPGLPSPYIVPYVIAIRDNSAMRCPLPQPTPAPPPSPPSTGALVGMVVGAGIIAGLVVGLILRFVPARVPYAHIREAINENHEA